MALKAEQAAWLSKFTALEAAQNSFDQEMALKKSILADVRKQLGAQKELLRKAMTFDIAIDGEKIGKMLQRQINRIRTVVVGLPVQLRPAPPKRTHHHGAVAQSQSTTRID